MSGDSRRVKCLRIGSSVKGVCRERAAGQTCGQSGPGARYRARVGQALGPVLFDRLLREPAEAWGDL